jgi:hypothetical protein
MTKLPKVIKQIREHKLLEIDKESQKNISYSQMQVYDQCPHRWKLTYKDKIKVYKPSIHTVFGKAFHETVQDWLTTLYEVSGVAADAMDLEDKLYEGLIFHYSDEKKNNDGEHFVTAKDLQEFYEDGCTILKYIKKNRAAYFGKQGWHLVGVEIPLMIQPIEDHPGVLFKGFIDLVLYHEPSDEYHIFDIKTSTRGWGDKDKKDEMKQSQLILYKNFFNKQFGVDPEKIHIKFFIVKRKLWEQSDFVQKRVQEFIPASGPMKTKKAVNKMEQFIKECFEPTGEIKERVYARTPSASACKFCPFYEQPRYCEYAGAKFK